MWPEVLYTDDNNDNDVDNNDNATAQLQVMSWQPGQISQNANPEPWK